MMNYYAFVARQKMGAVGQEQFGQQYADQEPSADYVDYVDTADNGQFDTWFDDTNPALLDESIIPESGYDRGYNSGQLVHPENNIIGEEHEEDEDVEPLITVTEIEPSEKNEENGKRQSIPTLSPPPMMSGPPTFTLNHNMGQPRQRYAVPQGIQVSTVFSPVRIVNSDPEGSDKDVEYEDEDEDVDHENPTKRVAEFPTDFQEFDFPDEDDKDDDPADYDLADLAADDFAARTPLPIVRSEMSEVVQWENGLKAAGTKDKEKMKQRLDEQFGRRKEQIEKVKEELVKPVSRKARKEKRAVREEVEKEFETPLGVMLSEEQEAQKAEKLRSRLKPIESNQEAALLDIGNRYSKCVRLLRDAYNDKLKFENSRINRAVAQGMVKLQKVKDERRKKANEIKRDKQLRDLKNFWTPYETRYLNWEPAWLRPARKILFSYDEASNTHRLVLLYRWFDTVKLLGVFILFLSFLYATGYIDRWFVKPFNMFDQARREYLDEDGRLVMGALTVFGLMGQEVHGSQINWILRKQFDTKITLQDVQEGYVTTFWSDGLPINVSTLLLYRRLRAEAKQTGMHCICAAHMGIPLNVVYFGYEGKDMVLFEPFASTQSKAKYRGKPLDVFKHAAPELTYPKVAFWQYFTVQDGGKVGRMEVQGTGNMCITRCAQVLGKKTS